MTSPRVGAWLALAAALIMAAICYWPSLHGPFLLDDFDAVVPLAQAQEQGVDTLEALRNGPPATRSRYLSNLSFLASQAAGGTQPPTPFVFKLGNLLLHLACALAAFALARRAARLAGREERTASTIAVLVAAWFALHPLLVSTVLYPSQRMAQLSTLFLLLSANAYAAWRTDYDQRTPLRHALGVGAVLAFAGMALLAKESGALAPLLILAVELTLFRWPASDAAKRSRFDTGFGLACAAPLVLGLIGLGVTWRSILAGYERRDFTLPERLLTELHVLAGYLGQILLPRPGSMGLLLDDIAVRSTWTPGTALIALAFAAAIVGALAMRRRWPLLALGVLWFFASHALESSLFALELAFEHRNYLALFGPALAVASLAMARPRLGIVLGALAAAMLAVLTWQRAQHWRSYDGWIASEVANHPASLRAGTERMFHYLGRDETALAATERERLAAALPGHAQPTLLKLAFACRGIIPIELFPHEDLQALRRGRIGKDGLHVYGALQSYVERRCGNPDWPAFAAASRALAENRASRSSARMRAGWWRFNVTANLRLEHWPGVQEALQNTVREENNDPRDWLLLAEAHLRLGDRPGYFQARQRFLQLVQGRPGPLAGQLERLDAMAAPPPAQ